MFADEIDTFVGALQFEFEMADNTCEAYARDLRSFTSVMAQKGKTSAAELVLEDIDAYLRSERENGMASSTRARGTAAIKVWLRYLKDRRIIRTDPAELLVAPKKAKLLPRILSEEETFALLDKIDGLEPRDLRDRAMLEVMYGCGLRVSEVCGLKQEDIVAEGELLRILGKGSKERLVPLGGAAGRALTSYFASARDAFTRGDISETHVFVTRFGKPFTRQGVFKIIKERAVAADISPDRISPHVLRHCFASHMLQHGADIRAIQELLGHADIGTTQIYTHVDTARFAEIHKLHPRH